MSRIVDFLVYLSCMLTIVNVNHAAVRSDECCILSIGISMLDGITIHDVN